MKPSFLIAGIGLAIAIIFGLQHLMEEKPQIPAEPPGATVAAVPTSSSESAPPDSPESAGEALLVETDPELPSLDDSDPTVRELLAPHDLPQPWLEPEQLLRRFATLLDNAAGGGLPKKQLGFLAPKGDFAVTAAGTAFRVDPRTYARFDPIVDALEKIEVQSLASMYRRLEPLLVVALGELGQRKAPDLLLAAAVAEVSRVPQLSGDELLVRPKVLYRYQDPALEQLKPLQKQLLRMGPDNLARIQGYLVELAEVLQLPDPG